VALSPTVVADLRAWTIFSSPQPERWLFPSENREKPLGRDNVWRRSIEPKLRQVSLEWATFQVMRRTYISLSRKAGVDPKVIAEQAGHDLDVSVKHIHGSRYGGRNMTLRPVWNGTSLINN
jgi:hypothetical protein